VNKSDVHIHARSGALFEISALRKVLSEDKKLQNPSACHRTHPEGVCSQTDYGDRKKRMGR